MSLSSYLVTCVTEGLRIVSDYRISPPISCPHDGSHTIDPLQTKIYHTITAKQVVIKDDISTVQGFYQCIPYDFDIPPTLGMGTYDFYSPLYQVQVRTTNICVCDENLNDEVIIHEFPDTVIGATTAIANVGDVTFIVSPTVITYMKLGFAVKIGGYDVGVCTNIDDLTNTITTATPLSTLVTVGGIVQITKIRVEKLRMCHEGLISLGQNAYNIFVVPPNTHGRLYYNNISGLAKKFQIFFEVYY